MHFQEHDRLRTGRGRRVAPSRACIPTGPAMTFDLRKSILQVHRWTGLTIGLVILMMAVTGAVNLFRPSLEPVVNEALLTVPACSERATLAQLTDKARAFHGAGSLDYIDLLAPGED